MIDAHFHSWQLARGDYGWLTPALAPIHRDVDVADWWREARPHGVSGGVLVQAAPTEAETAHLLALAERHPQVLGVVGWVDWLAPDAPARIAALARHPRLKGLRPMLQDIPDPDWILQPALRPCLDAMAAHGLVFDALVKPVHLPRLPELARRHPTLRVVVDHGAKPDIARGEWQPWADGLARLARETTWSCKLSGLLTECGPAPRPQAARRWADHLLACFGPERVLWGSDWPVLELAADYTAWWTETQALLATLSPAQQQAVLGGNAARLYALSPTEHAMTTLSLNLSTCLPTDAARATLIGRTWVPGRGALPVTVHQGQLLDLSPVARTCSEWLERESPAQDIRQALAAGTLRPVATLDAALANSDESRRDPTRPWLLAPCDLQVVKASGVTFIASLLERVIEEQARGDAARADGIRQELDQILGADLRSIVPGSPEAAEVKRVLLARGAWSQYLEVGLGPDAEIFTKAPVLAAVGTGADVGIHPESHWNNPEPEVVLAVNSRGHTLGAALGNDVNLRDFEGRSALLLGKAKDNNGSCAIGPFIRLFDEHFGIDDVCQARLTLGIAGPDGFSVQAEGEMSTISRHPLDIVGQAINANHQYPDGFMLFLGTMIAPTQDRHGPGKGFTHEVGDVVTVHTPRLGTLANRVRHACDVAPWQFGLAALMRQWR